MKFSDIDFNDIVKVGHRGFLKRKIFNTNWLLGRYCNYSCSYCWSYANTKKKDHRPFEIISSAINNIFYQAKERGYNEFSFSFSGGEPTLHPNFLDILQYLNTDGTIINITSNCSKSESWFNNMVTFKNISSFTASFHPQSANEYEFRKKLEIIRKSGIRLLINVVMQHDNFDEMKDYAKIFYEDGYSVQPKIEIEYIDGKTIEKPYTKDQIDFIKNGLKEKSDENYMYRLIDKNGIIHKVDNVERLIGLNFNRFKDWYCEAGYRSIIIHEPSGLVKRHYLCHDEPLGHIEKGFKLHDIPKKCITEICGSSADCKIPKFKERTNVILPITMDLSSSKK
jgi:MoaA/NifB/PqqE/SkfB family radical SAM enzyme